jgi:hypothetical protein
MQPTPLAFAAAAAILILRMQVGNACTMDDLKFMAGDWRSADGNSHGEEQWTWTAASTLSGSSWFAEGTTLKFAEVLSISGQDSMIEMHLRRFDGALNHAWEDKDAPMIFRLARCERALAVFDGTGTKEGEHITYTRSGGSLTFVGDFLRKGAPFRLEVRMRAVK